MSRLRCDQTRGKLRTRIQNLKNFLKEKLLKVFSLRFIGSQMNQTEKPERIGNMRFCSVLFWFWTRRCSGVSVYVGRRPDQTEPDYSLTESKQQFGLKVQQAADASPCWFSGSGRVLVSCWLSCFLWNMNSEAGVQSLVEFLLQHQKHLGSKVRLEVWLACQVFIVHMKLEAVWRNDVSGLKCCFLIATGDKMDQSFLALVKNIPCLWCLKKVRGQGTFQRV